MHFMRLCCSLCRVTCRVAAVNQGININEEKVNHQGLAGNDNIIQILQVTDCLGEAQLQELEFSILQDGGS